MKVKYLIHIIIILSLLVSCNKNEQKQIELLVKQWRHKELLFPIYHNDADSINNMLLQTDYKVVTYIDSVECTTCELGLEQWLLFLNEINVSSLSNVPLVVYSHPKNKDVLQKILEWEEFSCPVIYDEDNTFFNENQIPSNSMFQTFLLNAKNEVVVIGNPIKNHNIKKLYKETLGINYKNKKKTSLTTINIDKKIIDFKIFPFSQEQTAEIILLNTGDNPLTVPNVISSCGCIKVKYNKQPIKPNEKLYLKVSYNPNRKGFFRKILNIYCNTEISPIQVKIYGHAN